MALSKNNCCVLVIEDDQAIRDTFQDALESEGYTVKTASNGKEGLEVLRTLKPCLILLDFMMPVMNGSEFLNVVKSDSALAAIPIFLISAIADEQKAHGCAGFIKKPADLEMILDKVCIYCN